MTYVPPEDTRWLPWAPIRDRLAGRELPEDLAYIAHRASRLGIIPVGYARLICGAIGTSIESIDAEIATRARKLRGVA